MTMEQIYYAWNNVILIGKTFYSDYYSSFMIFSILRRSPGLTKHHTILFVFLCQFINLILNNNINPICKVRAKKISGIIRNEMSTESLLQNFLLSTTESTTIAFDYCNNEKWYNKPSLLNMKGECYTLFMKYCEIDPFTNFKDIHFFVIVDNIKNTFAFKKYPSDNFINPQFHP